MKIYFCPKCHHKIIPPAFLSGSNVKAEKGITLSCGNCKKGKVKIKLPQQKEEQGTEQQNNMESVEQKIIID